MKTLVKWTVTDYHSLIETGILGNRQVELLQGELVEMPPEGPIHSYITEGSVHYLRSLLQGLAVVREAHPITLSDSEPQPDIAIVQPPRQRYRQRHPYPQDIFWLIEISQSTLEYDLNDKKKTYALAGIPEYWVVNVRAHHIHIFRHPQSDDYLESLVISQGTIVSQAFSTIEVSIDRFWADI
ncbi:MAG: Uma2 family endonuclease [Coleofasciculus sp. C1-SOL-03]|uniref:Uma2 family endonuclease n=1 Tax=Coleofasciculus sp. C1-SOL-03 TaxID=3069522 RepID=UPI0032F77350